MKISDQMLLELVRAGAQAPSPDNLQPWKFKRISDGFELYFDRDYMGHFFDNNEIATRMSCGALLENVTLHAATLGHEVSIEYPTGETGPVAILRIKQGAPVVRDPIAEAVFSRCTDRRLYRPSKKLDSDEIEQLDDAVNSNDGYRLHWYADTDARKEIIKIITLADTIRFSHAQAHRDFHDVLRFGDAAERTKDGLAEKTLGIESLFIPVLKWLAPWPVTRTLNKIGLHYIMALRGTWLPMVSAPHIAAITHSGKPDDMDAGRVMQRFWLACAALEISTQPLGAFPLFLSRLHRSSGAGFSPGQIDMLTKLGQRTSAITPGFNPHADQFVMFFRLGRASSKSLQHAYRRPAESFLMEKADSV
jgi:nitroreductase